MSMDWILSPFVQYALTGVGLAASAYLWVSAKTELSEARRRLDSLSAATEERMKILTTGLEEMRNKPSDDAWMPLQPVTPSLNLTRRTQVLRMHRRGETPSSIAGGLGLSISEIELLLKLNLLLESQPV